MTAFYNEPDPYAAAWLRNLIAAGHIAFGIVDERPIQEIEAWELVNFTQCHFFAGIGVWSYALRRAGWPDDRPIWTGSCPCQPFSNAGKQKGFSDDRHLWPYWSKLIAQFKPPVVVGEQVASALEWIDLVSTDLEAQNYAFGASDLCAAGFNGAHIRQRLYFVGLADSSFTTSQRNAGSLLGAQEKIGRKDRAIDGNSLVGFADGSNNGGLADDDDARSQGWGLRGNSVDQRAVGQASMAGRLEHIASDGRIERGAKSGQRSAASGRASGGLADDDSDRRNQTWKCVSPAGNDGLVGNSATDGANTPMLGRNAVDWLYCRDGKWRPVEPGTFPLVNETSSRVGRLRAYGNALDAETATIFCQTIREISDNLRPIALEYDL